MILNKLKNLSFVFKMSKLLGFYLIIAVFCANKFPGEILKCYQIYYPI